MLCTAVLYKVRKLNSYTIGFTTLKLTSLFIKSLGLIHLFYLCNVNTLHMVYLTLILYMTYNMSEKEGGSEKEEMSFGQR